MTHLRDTTGSRRGSLTRCISMEMWVTTLVVGKKKSVGGRRGVRGGREVAVLWGACTGGEVRCFASPNGSHSETWLLFVLS